MVKAEAIKLKRAYAARAAADGARLLVDRIWPRGLSNKRAALDAWMKDVAPSAELRHWFNHQPDRWEEFRTRYTDELRHKEEEVKLVADFVKRGTVTLLYAARDDEHNNAVVLRDFLMHRKSD
ncbi:uncharacterized protein YeaO (DUF488 family) [Rhizobium sp. BK529]|uniref:DUF488 domain-containing protein n=1 Tax=unclassified Rhizobium TaxID=2613769 RepID=UPI0010EE224C|nr:MULTISPECIES: DUF488 family protein [unclassified Rhizobium]MBB3593591.1 uncharacterized protein YeaO (DUF488 family) [Rhizobium sp. BK529]TCS03379.1 uncharacterized protein YeaO (DUF488 family) [Rhizobium sp. BK418]